MEYATAVQCWDRAVSKNAPRVETKTRTVNATMRELGMYSARNCEPLPNALGFVSPVTKNTCRVYGPRRAAKRVLLMTDRGQGPQYQGLDPKTGAPVWGDEPELVKTPKAPRLAKAPRVKGAAKIKRAKKIKPEVPELVWNADSTIEMIRPGVFRRVKSEE